MEQCIAVFGKGKIKKTQMELLCGYCEATEYIVAKIRHYDNIDVL